MMTSRSGAALRVTVTVTSFSFSLGVDVSSLSSTLYAPAPKFTVNTGWSSSLMETTVSWVVPALILSGNGLSKLISTDSSSSSSASSAAVKVKVCSVSVAPNVRLVVDME